MPQPQGEMIEQQQDWAGWNPRFLGTALGTPLATLLVGLVLLSLVMRLAPLSADLQDSAAYAYAYASLHLLAKLPAVVVTVLIFVFGWHAKKDTPNNILILALGFGAVGLMGLGDALSASGMPGLIKPNMPGESLDFQFAARLLGGITLVGAAMAALRPWRGDLQRHATLSVVLAALLSFAWVVIFRPAALPPVIGTDNSPTGLAIGLQFFSAALHLGAAITLALVLSLRQERYFRYLFACAFVAVLGETFEFIPDDSGVFHLVNDVYQLIAYVLVCKAVFVYGIGEPYRRLEAAQREAETARERFRGLTELSSDWYWELDDDFRFTMSAGLSPTASQLLWGQAVIGKTRWELPYYIDMAPPQWQEHRRQLEAHEPFRDFELTRVAPDGHLRSLSISGQPVFDHDGRFMGYRGVGRDITQRKRTETLLATENRLLDMLLGGQPLEAILGVVCEEVEKVLRGAVAVLLLCAEDGKNMRLAAAPSLSDSLRRNLDGIPSDPAVCPCGEPGATHEDIVLREFSDDPLWAHFGAHFSSGQLGTTWTSPIVSRNATLGMLSLYFAKPLSPADADRQFLSRMTQLAAVAVERSRSQEAERLIAQVFDSAHEGILIVAPDDRIIMANPEFTAITGYTAEELVGRYIHETGMQPCGPEHEALYAEMNAALDREGYWSGVRWNRRKNGEAYYEHISVSAVCDNDGKPTLFAAFRSDITAQKTAEQAVRESEAQLRLMTDNMPVAILELDRELRVRFANPLVAKLAGVDSADIVVGQPIRRLIPDAGRYEEAREVYGRVLQGESITLQTTFRAIDDQMRDFELTHVPARNSDGQITGCYILTQEITERVRAQAALRDSEEQYRLIAGNMPIALTQLDLDYRIRYVNATAEAMSGIPIAEATGRRISDNVDAATWEHIAPRIKEAFQGRQTVGQHEYCGRSGRTWLVENIFVPARDARGRIVGCYVLSQDMTERMKAERELRTLNEELEQRVQERTRVLESVVKELEAFSHSVSHDLRAPLRGIEGFMRIIEQKYADRLDDTGRGYLARVRRNSVRMGELIDDLLSLSDVSRGACVKTEVDLSGMCRSILADLMTMAPDRKLAIEIEDGIVRMADRRLLQVALENLLSNAWKFTAQRNDARIIVGTSASVHGDAVYIRDNGAGFDMRFADKLFESFQRLHSSVEFEGTGIGLAIVQRVVNRHGGKIWADGAVGVGATFYFVL